MNCRNYIERISSRNEQLKHHKLQSQIVAQTRAELVRKNDAFIHSKVDLTDGTHLYCHSLKNPFILQSKFNSVTVIRKKSTQF